MLIFVSNNLIICIRSIRDRPHVGELSPFLSAVTLTNLNCIKMPAPHVEITFQTPCSLIHVLSSSDILCTLYPYFTIRMTNIMSKTVLNTM